MTRSETLDKAKACVCGQRENEYGSPEDLSLIHIWFESDTVSLAFYFRMKGEKT